MLSKLCRAAKYVLNISSSKVAAFRSRGILPNQEVIFKFVSNNIKALTAGGMIMTLYVSATYSEKRKMDQVIASLVKGSMPHIEHVQDCCAREKELNELKKAILSTEATEGTSGMFFIVVGPNGCGKSWLMKKLCCQDLMGLIYYQVYDSESFPIGLGRVCGMSFEMQGNIWQTIVGWGNLPYKSWFILPKESVAALSYVFEVLETQGRVFKAAYGKIPTIVIDSVDILAKTAPELFNHLIRLSKRVINDGTLNIVLVSSEGHVIPAIKSLAEKSRIKELHVGDLSDKEAVNMLKRGGLSENVSQELLATSGPRVQYIKRMQMSARLCGFPEVAEDTLTKCIKDELKKEAQDCIRLAKAHKAGETFKVKKVIMQHVLKKSNEGIMLTILMDQLQFEVCQDLTEKNSVQVDVCLKDLLRGNVLTIKDDKIMFHSRLLQIYAKKFLESDSEQPIEL